MPFVSSVEGTFGYGRQPQITFDPTSPIVSGNATTNMNITGSTAIPGVAGQDDAFGPIPTDATFNFNFFGTNYGGVNG
jgi:hypothetical protein